MKNIHDIVGILSVIKLFPKRVAGHIVKIIIEVQILYYNTI